MKVYISGVEIDLAAIGKVKKLEDVEKLDIFCHLEESAAKAANAELFAQLNPKKEDK